MNIVVMLLVKLELLHSDIKYIQKYHQYIPFTQQVAHFMNIYTYVLL